MQNVKKQSGVIKSKVHIPNDEIFELIGKFKECELRGVFII